MLSAARKMWQISSVNIYDVIQYLHARINFVVWILTRKKKNFAKVSKNLIRYRSDNNFISLSK